MYSDGFLFKVSLSVERNGSVVSFEGSVRGLVEGAVDG